MFRTCVSFTKTCWRKYSTNLVRCHEEVKTALTECRPVVALESTIITHGMPFPQNVKCAMEVEDVVRSQGAVPATVAILNGKLTVGLTQAEIETLGDIKQSDPVKTSRRDLSYVLSTKRNGGTTVSGTIIACAITGIPIFATGGIGGVHRRAETSLDISADLTELGRSNVAVVSSGVKSILDIPKTLEYLAHSQSVRSKYHRRTPVNYLTP
ncbi:pseudouridine-5'-phosphate glycosidase-like isoform X1 [Rhynchophorus ferrugineus]|uniref:pseudouridine-5'-phosphate glycosidase-like isoform X1 n=1 Tax=Rhynchophorus ferrugineus TaxID=354439 RepID=UPI003FCD1AB5